MINNDALQVIKQVIDEYNLKLSIRKYEYVYPRYYLYNHMRKMGFTLEKIGRFFDKDHATIMHGIKMHEQYMNNKDQTYLDYVRAIQYRLGTPVTNPTIFEDIMNCHSLSGLKIIKDKIKENFY